MTGDAAYDPHGAHHSSTKSLNGIMDDDDGRTRNAKAQRRHREKRKAHLKTLEETVANLQGQLEDARRQLTSVGYGNRPGGGPPGSPNALQQECYHLREENAELRRQLYNSSVGAGGAGGGRAYHEGDVKGEGYAQYGAGGAPLTSPREGSNGGREGQLPNNDGFTPRGSRSRVMSSSSAPAAASPYPPPISAFPTDPRAHALSSQQQQQADRYPVRYEPHLYGGGGSGGSGGGGGSAGHSPTTASGNVPHSVPRSGLGGHEYLEMYNGRDEGNWGADAGPPPFQSGAAYPVPYGDGPSDEWRQGQDHSH